VTAASEQTTRAGVPRIVLCATAEPLARAWTRIADGRPGVEVHHGSILEVPADAVISPANSHGLMRGGLDAVYAQTWPTIEARVRSAILALHGGELPVGEAVVVPTGGVRPAWLISAPTMREPTDRLPEGTVHPYLAARAVFRLWRDGLLEDGRPVRRVIGVLALPGLGTGVGGVDPEVAARQLAAAWDESFTPTARSATA
jgi:O-acetyl-ADP-ribose deacetylase (regulator of RNase III)